MAIKIYLITNTVTNQKYVGQTILDTIEERFNQHVRMGRKSDNCLLHDGILDYGRLNFKIELLDVVDDIEANEKETFYIKKMKSHYKDGDRGYNMKYQTNQNAKACYHNHDPMKVKENLKIGRAWNYGLSFSDEAKKKMIETKKYRSSLGLYTNYGHPVTEEAKKILSEKAKGRKLSSKTKKKIGNASKGRKFIYNPILKERKCIKDSDIPPGWKRGNGMIWMNKDGIGKSIDIWNREMYLEKGYKDGRV